MRQRDFAALHHDALAAHAAKIGQIVLGGEATTVDDAGVLRCLTLTEAKLDAFRLHLIEQEAQCGLRCEVAFIWEKQAGLKTAS